MALPPQWDFLHSKTHLADRKSLLRFVESSDGPCGECYEHEPSHSAPMMEPCTLFALQLLLSNLLCNYS